MNKKRILIISAIFIIILGIIIFTFYRNAFSNGSNDSGTSVGDTSSDEAESDKRIPMSEVYKDAPMALKILYFNDEPTKKVVFSTGTKKFTEDSFEEYKNELFSYFFLGNWPSAINSIEGMLSTYDLNSIDFYNRRPFEVFLWEFYESNLCNNFIGFKNKTKEYLKEIDSPEIILYPYLYLDPVDQYAMIQNKFSDAMIIDEFKYNEDFFIHEVSYVDLELEEKVEMLFWDKKVPTNVNTFKIFFEIDGVEYNLYYTQSKDTKEINYIYLESNWEDRMYVYEYYNFQYLNLEPTEAYIKEREEWEKKFGK